MVPTYSASGEAGKYKLVTTMKKMDLQKNPEAIKIAPTSKIFTLISEMMMTCCCCCCCMQ
jgi:hypothetical protein